MRLCISPECFVQFFDKLVHPSNVGENFEKFENLFASTKTE